MKLIEKKSGGNFTPHPVTDANVRAVIVDVTPPKEVVDKFNDGKTKLIFKLVFESELMDEANDRRFLIWSSTYTPSLHEKSNFRKDLKRIFGRDLTRAELDGFETEDLIGMGVKIAVDHEVGQDGDTYTKIARLLPDNDKPLKASGNYKRVKDRDADGATVAPEPVASGWQAVQVHIGKHAGKALGVVDEAGVETLIGKWLPKAKADGKAEDAALVAALEEVQALLSGGGDDY